MDTALCKLWNFTSEEGKLKKIIENPLMRNCVVKTRCVNGQAERETSTLTVSMLRVARWVDEFIYTVMEVRILFCLKRTLKRPSSCKVF
jgi:hypothetical protein